MSEAECSLGLRPKMHKTSLSTPGLTTLKGLSSLICGNLIPLCAPEAGLIGNSYVIRDPLTKKCSFSRTLLFWLFASDVGKTERYSAIMRMSATTAA